MDYEEVLRLINVARRACGKDVLAAIRDGEPEDTTRCPIAVSLDGGDVAIEYQYAAFKSAEDAARVREAWGTIKATRIGYEQCILFGTSESVPWSNTAVLPDLLQEFVHAYDAGDVPYDVAHYPEPDEDDEEED